MRVLLTPHSTKYIVLLAISCLIVISIYIHNRGSGDSHKDNFTNKINFLPAISDSVNNTIDDVKIFDRFVTVEFNNNTILLIHVKEGKPLITSDYSVIFLHGASFSSETWVKLKSLQLATALGYNTYAIDLPGWGKSTTKNEDGKLENAFAVSRKFLKLLIDELGVSMPVIVTPSMSGKYSINYFMEPDPRSCRKRVRGLLALAPTSTEEYTYSQYHKCEAPVMIIFGSKDKNLGLISTSYLRNMPYYDMFRIDDAGHACYVDKPDQFNRILNYFLRGLKASW